jgi:FkbM family methyltransferase
MKSQIIFDIGCHNGQDANFYLKKGFYVIAVEANPRLNSALKQRFSNEIEQGRFILVEKAIAEWDGEVEFFDNVTASIWGTIRSDQALRNGVASNLNKITVPSIRFATLIEKYGVPYYLKVDIEGADLLCLEGLEQTGARPKYVSIECEQHSLAELCSGVNQLHNLGYKKFKIVNQALVPKQRSPFPPKEGHFVDHQFDLGSAGLFGDELPGEWMSRYDALRKYCTIYGGNKLHGLLKRLIRSNRAGSWYDLHAGGCIDGLS